MKNDDFINTDIKFLIVSYLTGSISVGDLEKLNEWIDVSPENREYFNKLKDTWILSGVRRGDSEAQINESWDVLKHKLSQNRIRFKLVKGVRSREKVNFMKYLRLAASWLLIFGLGSAVTWWLNGSSKDKIVLTNSISNNIIEISTPMGAKSMIKMPDNTQIWLNAGTTITYSQDYGTQTRSLNLKGEAYFKVAKDSLHPFIVNTQGITVRALGTRFNVKAYPEEKTISATLEEGKIEVGVIGIGRDNRILLRPKDKLIYHKETKGTEKYTQNSDENLKPEMHREDKIKDVNVLSNVRTELFTSWKDSRWIIDREPLSTLTPMLERRFNMKIILNDEQLKKYKFTGIIENETIEQVLNALRLTAPLNYQVNKDTLRLNMDVSSKEEFKRIMTRKN